MLSALVCEKDYMGTGQISVTDRVENYPGLYGINGYDLGEKFREQAETLGAEFYEGEAESFEKTAEGWKVIFKDGSAKYEKTKITASFKGIGSSFPSSSKALNLLCAASLAVYTTPESNILSPHLSSPLTALSSSERTFLISDMTNCYSASSSLTRERPSSIRSLAVFTAPILLPYRSLSDVTSC